MHELTKVSEARQRMADPIAVQTGAPQHVLAASTPSDEQTRVLKHGDTFAVFDRYGDVRPGGLGEEGLYHEGTRYLSCLVLELEGSRPFFLGSTIRDGNDQLSIDLTNPDQLHEGRVRVALGTLHLSLQKFLWQGSCYQRLRVKNHGLERLDTWLMIYFAADFADIFEVRGLRRKNRGEDLPPEVTEERVVLAYRGLDTIVRRTLLQFAPRPSMLTASSAQYLLTLRPGEETTVDLRITCERPSGTARPLLFDEARAEAEADLQRYRSWSCHLRTTSGQVNAWTDRAVADLHMMTTELGTGPYPYAGVPWFNTPFGRDGIITALECLWLRPELARGVLTYLSATQARDVIPEQDAEPGKILHETRWGEMAILKEIPFGRYYGSVDATPLFVVLAGAYYERTGDLSFVHALWPNVEAALGWIDRYGDRDGDGFVEYQRQTADGLLHQGWKDSDDGVFHADGSIARGPIALCEVQGYVYAARCAGAQLATALGLEARAAELKRLAGALQEQFERAFWCEDLQTYAMALDGEKRPCRVRSSNAGHCLFAGIAGTEHARRVARTLLSAESFSGWGVRTVALTEARYNPMGYHTGSVWPHDNALIAEGLARYGFGELAVQLLTGLFEASLEFDLHRMPELFCGFPQRPGEGPVLYPVACSPQAWAAGAVFMLFHACLGLRINAPGQQVCFNRPRLPAAVEELRIHNLEVAGASVDLLVLRHAHDVGVNVLRCQGHVQIIVAK